MYLVERLGSSSVVARLESLGLVPRALSDPAAAVPGRRCGPVSVISCVAMPIEKSQAASAGAANASG